MAIARARQAVGAVSTGSVSFGTLPSAGSRIIVVVTQYRSGSAPTQPTIADNQGVGNTYSLVTSGTATFSSGSDNWRVSMFISSAIGATSGTFTVTRTATDGDVQMAVAEYTGVDTTSPVNTSNNATAGAGSTAITRALTTTVADCVGVAVMTGSVGSNPFTMTPANETATLIGEQENNSTAQSICFADGAWASAASHTAGFTHASSQSGIVAAALAPLVVAGSRPVKMAGEWGGFAGPSGGFAG